MNTFIETLLTIGALVIGGVVGLLFGLLQTQARRQNKKLSDSGKLKSGWMVMPGSFGRIAILLMVLALIQVCVPMLFKGNIQWIVSLGILLGYGWTFVKQLKQRAIYKN
ncbi:MAG: hypothetical protein M1480_16010 [Bacteroidetes bacterium]|nr:hypothetical protein [Bacteroidota bacterium]